MITNLFPTPIYEARYDENLEPYIQKCLELKDTVECGVEGQKENTNRITISFNYSHF